MDWPRFPIKGNDDPIVVAGLKSKFAIAGRAFTFESNPPCQLGLIPFFVYVHFGWW